MQTLKFFFSPATWNRCDCRQLMLRRSFKTCFSAPINTLLGQTIIRTYLYQLTKPAPKYPQFRVILPGTQTRGIPDVSCIPVSARSVPLLVYRWCPQLLRDSPTKLSELSEKVRRPSKSLTFEEVFSCSQDSRYVPALWVTHCDHVTCTKLYVKRVGRRQ